MLLGLTQIFLAYLHESPLLKRTAAQLLARFPLLSRVCLLSLGGAFFSFACESNPAYNGGGNGDGEGSGSANALGGGTAEGGIDLGSAGHDGNGASSGTGDGDGDGGPVCENVSSDVELAPIYLAFAFDVSGSMGQYDRPQWWHDPAKKWKPVVEATTAFFEDPESVGISASMGLFPAQAEKCDSGSYSTPEVAMTALPSTSFATTFGAYEAEVSDSEILVDGNWRGGTPTLAAFGGTAGYLSSFQAANPEAKFAVVLVTDGTPQGCGDDDAIGPIATAAETLYDGGSGVPTYVIGIENPTTPPAELPDGWADWGSGGNGDCTDPSVPCTPPNALADLHSVAEKGGTTEAFLIDTADPAATKANFRRAIDAIRTKAISCELPIPEHPKAGMTFDKDKIDVTVTVGSNTSRLDYDPTCTASDAWHYDDEDDASEIILCPDTCAGIQSQPGADLNVDFLCEDRPIVIH